MFSFLFIEAGIKKGGGEGFRSREESARASNKATSGRKLVADSSLGDLPLIEQVPTARCVHVACEERNWGGDRC